MCVSYFLIEFMGYMTEPLFKQKAGEVTKNQSDANSLFANVYVFCNLASLVCVQVLSWLSDRFGCKSMILAAFAMRILSVWLFEWAETPGWVYLFSIVRGVGEATSTLYVAMLADMISKSFRTRYIAWLFAVGNFGVGISFPIFATIIGVLAGVALLLVPGRVRKCCDENSSSSEPENPQSNVKTMMILIAVATVLFNITVNIELTTKQCALEHHYEHTYCFDGKCSEKQSTYSWLCLSQQLARATVLAIVGFAVTGGEFLIATGAIVGLGAVLLVSAFPIHVLSSSSMHVLFHGLLGASTPMFFSITSQLAGGSDQGKMLGILSFFKDLASVVAPKLAMWIWSMGTEARKTSETWAAILPACVGTFCALAAATILMIAWTKKRNQAKLL